MKQNELIDLSDYPKTKVCTMCNRRLPIEKFGRRAPNKDGYDSWCKECDRKYREMWHRKYYKEHKREIAGKHTMRTYGITIDDKEDILAGQDYQCAICGKRLPLLGHDTHIDHNHDTGEIRGILCNGCNNILGNAKDSVKILEKAIEYLNKDSYLV